MANPILMNVIEAFLTVGFRSPYYQYDVCERLFFKRNSMRGGGSLNLSVRPIHHDEVFEQKTFMQMIKSFCFPYVYF